LFLSDWGGGGQTFVFNLKNANFVSTNSSIANLMQNGQHSNLGEINLLTGGTMQVQGIGTFNTWGATFVNFNGGTLKAYTANTSFFGGVNGNILRGCYIYSGGGTIDNNGVAITIPQPLLPAAGNGVSSVTIGNGGSGYLSPPAVTFSGSSDGGGGNSGTIGSGGAAGYAVITNGVVTSIVITAPGTSLGSTPTITLTGGNPTVAASGLTVNTSANAAGGGMTFAGSGTTTLSVANTYTGPTRVTAGRLALGASGSIASSSSITVSNGAIFDVSAVSGFTLAASKSILGSGVVTGAVTAASTSKIYPGTDGTTGTLSFSNNLTMVAGSTFNLDVSTSSGSGNDQMVVANTLTLNSTALNLKALNGAANLDISTDYVLARAGSIIGSPNSTINWVGTQPGNAANFTVLKSGNNLVLHYAPATNPTNITYTVSNGTMTLSWPTDHTGWRLQTQTNATLVGLGTNWFDVFDSKATNTVNLPVDVNNGSVFYRLVYP
jgi:autotransporter-associated beta strand protein